MAKVYLQAADPNYDENHWANAYGIFKKAFASSKEFRRFLTAEPDKADVIIICGPMRNADFPISLLANPVIWENKARCVWFSTDDNVLPIFPGCYVALSARGLDRRYHQGGFYPRAASTEPAEPFPIDTRFKHLFSFCGGFDTHKVRQRIGLISEPRGMIKNTEKEPVRGYGKSAEVYKSFKESFIESISFSKFILCPRGNCPSSIRLFQTMKSRRVPVVISDDWARPPHVPWDDFCVFVSEKEVFKIPEILADTEDRFPEMANAARNAWEQYFSFEKLPSTVTEWSLELLATSQSHSAGLLRVPLSAYWRKFLSWHFYRRGVAPEVKYRAKKAIRAFGRKKAKNG